MTLKLSVTFTFIFIVASLGVGCCQLTDDLIVVVQIGSSENVQPIPNSATATSNATATATATVSKTTTTKLIADNPACYDDVRSWCTDNVLSDNVAMFDCLQRQYDNQV